MKGGEGRERGVGSVSVVPAGQLCNQQETAWLLVMKLRKEISGKQLMRLTTTEHKNNRQSHVRPLPRPATWSHPHPVIIAPLYFLSLPVTPVLFFIFDTPI